MRGAVGQCPWSTAEHQLGDLANAQPCTFFVNMFGTPIACIGKLAGKFPACPLIDHATDSVGETGAVHTVEDHFGDSKLASHGFATRLEIERLGQTMPLLATISLRQTIKVVAGIDRCTLA